MSLSAFIPVAELITIPSVECHVCGDEYMIQTKESVTPDDLNGYTCPDCRVPLYQLKDDPDKANYFHVVHEMFLRCPTDSDPDDHLTKEIFADRIEATVGVRYPAAYVESWFNEYNEQNMNGKAISAYDFINSLNLNDMKG